MIISRRGAVALTVAVGLGAAVSTAAYGAAAQAAPARAHTALATAAGARPPASPALPIILNGVSAASATDAWAVGDGPVLLHGNGTTWTPVTPPSFKGSSTTYYYGVDAVSAADVWAVGTSGKAPLTVIEHWNGTTWARTPSPSPGDMPGLTAVSGTATDAWAVGSYIEDNPTHAVQNLILHWNGQQWSRVECPQPAQTMGLSGVADVSPTDAWAAGATTQSSFVLHWNGSTWTQVTLSLPRYSLLQAVAADSGTDAWVVGSYNGSHALTLHWNGSTWTRVATPVTSPKGEVELAGVTAVSPTDAWAAGRYSPSTSNILGEALILHWNGTKWTTQTSPDPGGKHGTALYGVTAVGPTVAWAAGSYPTQGGLRSHPLLLSWNGTSWTRSKP
jgi:hypothetical protein